MIRRAGLAGAALAAVVGVAFLGCGQKAVGPRPVDSFGLADADVVVSVDVKGLAGSEFYTELVKQLEGLAQPGAGAPDSPDKMMKDMLGLGPADLERVVVSASADSKTFVVAASAGAPIDTAAVLAALSKEGGDVTKVDAHAGVDLYAQAKDDAEVMAFPAPQLIVAGTKDAVKEGIDRLKGGKTVKYGAKISSLLAGAPRGASFVVAIVPSAEMTQMAGGAAPVPGIGEAADKVAAVAITGMAGAKLDLGVTSEFKADKDAQDACKQATEGLTEGKAMLGELLKQGGMEPAKELLESIKISSSGKKVDIKASIRADVVKTIQPIMMQIMMSGMGNMMQPPGGMPQ